MRQQGVAAAVAAGDRILQLPLISAFGLPIGGRRRRSTAAAAGEWGLIYLTSLQEKQPEAAARARTEYVMYSFPHIVGLANLWESKIEQKHPYGIH